MFIYIDEPDSEPHQKIRTQIEPNHCRTLTWTMWHCFEPLRCLFFSFMFSRYCICTQASSIILGLNNVTFFCRWLCRPPKYLKIMFRFLGETQHYFHLPEFYVVFLYTLPLSLPKVIPPNPLVPYIPNRVQLGHYGSFKIPWLS